MLKMRNAILSICLVLVLYPGGGESNDERCSCRCPVPFWVDPFISTDFPERKVYINSTVKAELCDCEHVVQPVLSLNQEQVEKMCPRCQCRHEQRSTTTIKVVVILILWILVVLIIYLFYLLIIDPLLKGKRPVQSFTLEVRRRGDLPYQQQDDDEDNLADESFDNDVTATPLGSFQSRGVVNRLGREQDKWKRQVEIQRDSVYNTHSMLN